jgi:ribokinase
MGEEGVIYHDWEDIVRILAIDVKGIKDTTGAGDTFNGNFAYGVLCKLPLRENIERAQNSAAMNIQVETAQTGMPFNQELDNYID